MLRLEACLADEALQAIKGLGYSEAPYEAAIEKIRWKSSGNSKSCRRVNLNETN